MNKVLLWLDDFRDPAKRTFLLEYKNVVWVKDYDEFVEYIMYNELPETISFDHDLSLEHYDERISPENWREKTGLDCAKFLIEECRERGEKLPNCVIHSMNPVGAKNIKDLLLDFKNENIS